MPQAIRDTLPYFLGAVDQKTPTFRSRLHTLRRELRLAERRLEDATRLELVIPSRSRALLSEAVDAGLITSFDSAEDMFMLLRQALDAPTDPELGQPEESEYRRLVDESQRLTVEIRTIGDRVDVLRSAGADQDDYQGELSEQAARLVPLGLLGDPDNTGEVCPVCQSHLEEPDATVAELREEIEKVRTEVTAATAVVPARRKAVEELEGSRDSSARAASRHTRWARRPVTRPRTYPVVP